MGSWSNLICDSVPTDDGKELNPRGQKEAAPCQIPFQRPATARSGADGTGIVSVTAAQDNSHFAGPADADLAYVRPAWRKTYGECPAMPLPGNARTAANKMALATNEPSAAFAA